jgi:polygalacturonase
MALTKVSYSMIQGAPVNVVDFGATGDGITDDTAAIQSAINRAATTNSSVFFPAGTYLIQGTLTAGTLAVLYGEGIDKTILKKKSASTGHILDILGTTQKYDVDISGMTFDVNGIDSGIVAEYVTNFSVRNCKFKTMALWGVHVGVQNGADAIIRNTRVILENCIFENGLSTYEHFLIYNAQDVIVSGCSFKTGASAIGIGIYQNLERITIQNSFFAISIGLYYSVSTNNINITDCDFSQCTSGVQGANQSDNGAFGATSVNNLVIEGCRFRANTTGLQLGAVQNATVAGSIFDFNKQQALFIDDGNSPVASQSVNINIVDCVFQNNNFDNGASINNPAILFSAVGGAMYATISNCSFWDNQATRTQLYPIAFVGAFTWTDIIVSECRLSAYLGALSIGLSGGTLGANVRMLDCLDVSATVATGVLSNNIAYTVATLPTAANAGAGARAYVTNASATTFASTVAGSGANKVPVYSDGTNWLIG